MKYKKLSKQEKLLRVRMQSVGVWIGFRWGRSVNEKLKNQGGGSSSCKPERC